MKRALFVVAARRPARVEEALRAALGASLRGGAVTVWLAAARARTPLAHRALGVLQTFGHAVSEGGSRAALDEADAVEVWTEAGGEREAESDAHLEAEPDAHPEAESDAHLEAESDAGSERGTDAYLESDSGAHPEAGADAHPDSPSRNAAPASPADAEAAPPSPRLPTLHLLRGGARVPAALLGARDWLVTLGGAPRLHRHGAPPLPPGPLSFDELHRLVGLAARVVTW